MVLTSGECCHVPSRHEGTVVTIISTGNKGAHGKNCKSLEIETSDNRTWYACTCCVADYGALDVVFTVAMLSLLSTISFILGGALSCL